MSIFRSIAVVAILLTSIYSDGVYGNDINILITPVNPYSFGTKDFGNVTLVNQQSDITVRLKCVVKSFDGRILVEATSNNLLLKQGASTFSSINTSYQSIAYNDNTIKIADLRTRSLPAGNYEYCIEVYEATTGMQQGQECVSISLELLTPPIGIAPETGAELDNIFPYFSWIPPIPTPVNVRYVFTLVNVYEGQTSIDAVLRNPPLHQTTTGNNFYQYPVSAVQLEKGKKYAWQIKALMNEQPSENTTGQEYKSESEVYDFTLPKPPKPEKIYPFAEINTFGEDKVYYANDTLKIMYKEEYIAQKASYSITNERKEKITTSINAIQVTPGDNFIRIPLTALGIKAGEVYRLEFSVNNQRVYPLKFIRLAN